MKNKKGFSLVELLIVISIIGVLAGIIIPNVSRYLKKTHETFNDSLSTELINIVKNYYTENKNELPNGRPSYSKVVWASFLKNNNYFNTEFVDSSNNSCLNSYVVVEKENNDYKYTACIICDNDGYKTKNDFCKFTNEYNDTNSPECKNVTLVNENKLKNGNYINEDLTIKVEAKDDYGISMFKINDIIIPYQDSFSYTIPSKEDGLLNVNVLVYDKVGNSTNCNYNKEYIIDKTPPVININLSKTEYVNTNIYITGKITDNIALDGYGITTSDKESSSYIKIDNDVKEFIIPNDKLTIEKNGTYYVWAIDKAGNTSYQKIEVKNIDKTAPTCKLSASSSGVYISTSDNLSGVNTYGLSTSSITDYNNKSSLSLSIGTFYGYVKDNAGNTGSCSIEVFKTTYVSHKSCPSGYNEYGSSTYCRKWTSYKSCSSCGCESGYYSCPSGIKNAADSSKCHHTYANNATCGSNCSGVCYWGPSYGYSEQVYVCSDNYSATWNCSSYKSCSSCGSNYSYEYYIDDSYYSCGDYSKINDSYCYK